MCATVDSQCLEYLGYITLELLCFAARVVFPTNWTFLSDFADTLLTQQVTTAVNVRNGQKVRL